MRMCLFIIILCAISYGQEGAQTEENPMSYGDWLFVNGKEGKTPESFVAQADSAMVVTEGEAPTRIGIEILRQGGNAVDAAIAVSFALAVYRPQSTGLGGGGFALIYLKKENAVVAVDMRERAPLKATSDMYVRDGKVESKLSTTDALAVATPGLVAGLYQMYEKYGSHKLTWDQLVQPSIKLAKDGFIVYPHMAECIEWLIEKNLFEVYPATRKHLSRKDGTPLMRGDLYRNAELANTLTVIAGEGKDGFYKGDIARELISSVKEAGGILTQEDLDAYRVKYRIPVRGSYRGYDIYSMPPPSSGGVHIVQMLNILENYDVGALGFWRTKSLHLKAEVMRRAFADRSQYLGDPDFFPVPITGLTSKEYARRLSEGISLEKASEKIAPGTPEDFEKTSTTHFSIIDRDGNAVSSTQTINYYFGSVLMAGKTGFFLNNEMDDFSIQPGVPNLFGMVGGKANEIEPLKTPLSSMSPTIIVKDGKVVLILGSPGGSRIISAVLNVIVNVVDHHLSLRDAVFAPRVHHQWQPNQISLEQGGFDQALKKQLGDMGHVVKEMQSIGNVSAIIVDPVTGKITGVADPRREGKPLGY